MMIFGFFMMALVFGIMSLVVGIKEISRVEQMKPAELNKESMWVIGSIASMFLAGLGILIPLIHAVLNKNYEGLKKMLLYTLVSIGAAIMFVVSIIAFISSAATEVEKGLNDLEVEINQSIEETEKELEKANEDFQQEMDKAEEEFNQGMEEIQKETESFDWNWE